MSIFTIISIIVWALENIPNFVTAIKALIQLIEGIKDPAKRLAAEQELEAAFVAAKAGDVTAFETMLQKWQGLGALGMAPADLVK